MLQIENILNVLMTKNLSAQLAFYKTLGLELIFDNTDTFGLGINGKLFLVIREDKSSNSHHLVENKGPIILTFKCSGNANHYTEILKKAGIIFRGEVKLPEYKTHYIFIEDADNNELCLDFALS
jgi:catechol 2,3-dioxygenase-like lactoylglutathione lyase family enzyme